MWKLSNITIVNVTKKKQTLRYKEQTSGYLRGEERGGQNNDGQLRDKTTMCKIHKLQRYILIHGGKSQYCFSCLFVYFTILYWFCHTLTWIHHGFTCVPHPEPSFHLPPHSIPLGLPSAPAPSTLYHASNLDWRFVSHMITYRLQCILPYRYFTLYNSFQCHPPH